MTLLTATARRRHVGTPALPPTFTDANGPGGDRYTIPARAGVRYYVNGYEAGPATYIPTPGATVTVTAEATDGYQLAGAAQWSHSFTATYIPPTLGGLHDAIQALSPVGYWKLDNASGNAIDSSGYGRDGFYDGATRQGVDGFVRLGGTGRITVQGWPDWTIGTGMTVFALVKPETGTTVRAIAGKGVTGRPYQEWRLAKSATAQPMAEILTPAGVATGAVASTAALTDGVWHAVAARMASTSVDVIQNDTVTTSTHAAAAVTHLRDPLFLGAAPGLSSWLGGLAHVAIFRGALTNGQIAGLVAAARTEGLIP